MRTKFLAGLTGVVAAAAIAAPAQAQLISAPAPQVSAGTCKVRYSRDTGKAFTYAQCAINATNVPYGKTIKVQYKSNLKTFNPHSEIGPFKGTSGTIAFTNQGGLPGQTTGTAADMTQGIQLAFPGKRVASVTKHLKVTLSNATGGAVIAGATATAG